MKGVLYVFFGSVLLIGSCNTQQAKVLFETLAADSERLAHMGKGELMRHAYAMQAALAQDLSLLASLSGQDVSLMLATPDLERRDSPSVVWQYRSSRCVLDVYYTAEDADALKTATVQHYEMRGRNLITKEGSGAVDAQSCLQSIYHERRPQIEAGFEQIFAQADGRRG